MYSTVIREGRAIFVALRSNARKRALHIHKTAIYSIYSTIIRERRAIFVILCSFFHIRSSPRDILEILKILKMSSRHSMYYVKSLQSWLLRIFLRSCFHIRSPPDIIEILKKSFRYLMFHAKCLWSWLLRNSPTVNSQLNVLYKMNIELTFQKFSKSRFANQLRVNRER